MRTDRRLRPLLTLRVPLQSGLRLSKELSLEKKLVYVLDVAADT